MPVSSGKAARLYGIVSLDTGDGASLPAGVGVVSFRDLAGVVTESPYAKIEPTPDQVTTHRKVVEAVFGQRSILPAPFGTVFRSRDVLLRWLELHYFTLIEALTFVDDRLMVRVRIAHAADGEVQDESEARVHADVLEASAADSMRVLRRHAVASLVVTSPGGGASSVNTSFLVERDKWPVFRDLVQEEQKRLPDLNINASGPWPPYDFVRMQFGG